MNHDPNDVLTQEEIDVLIEEIQKAFESNEGIKKMIDESGLESETGCWHEWKNYKGFTDDYDYCTRCGVKE